MTPIHKQGSLGVIFRLALLSHGYTFISKATVPKLVRHLDREAFVYTERLVPLQGREVPVFLGIMDLERRPYYYDLRVTLVRMICLSWAGVELAEWKEGGDEAEWVEWRRKMVVCKATRAVERLHQEGVAHQDVAERNVMWREETNGAMVIDFGGWFDLREYEGKEEGVDEVEMEKQKKENDLQRWLDVRKAKKLLEAAS
jgi:hypothetical protein